MGGRTLESRGCRTYLLDLSCEQIQTEKLVFVGPHDGLEAENGAPVDARAVLT